VTEPWLFPIVGAIEAEGNRRSEQAQKDAERRAAKMGR
jgi:hypothetical protein